MFIWCVDYRRSGLLKEVLMVIIAHSSYCLVASYVCLEDEMNSSEDRLYQVEPNHSGLQGVTGSSGTCGFAKDALSRSGILVRISEGLQPQQWMTSRLLFRSGDLQSTTPKQNSTLRVMTEIAVVVLSNEHNGQLAQLIKKLQGGNCFSHL